MPPPRILALHGWGRDRHDFSEVLSGRDGVALDLPGFGATPAPDEPMGSAGYAHVVRRVLEEFEEAPLVVGHSFGGRVAVQLGADDPDRVRALLLIGTPLVRAPQRIVRPSLRYRTIRSLHRVGLVGEERLEHARRRYGSRDYRFASGVMRGVLVAVLSESYEDQLTRISCPVELLWGSEDAEVPVAVAERAANLLTDVKLTVLPGVGHDVLGEAPDAVTQTIDRLLT